jgi:hypothetical protein
MNFERYAGMASAVGIVLILMIVTWLDFWGPIDLSKLEKWQTLIAGTTTGFMALIAASIAYRGATAKVRHDREIVAQETTRRKLALYLKLEFAFRQLVETTRHLDVPFMFANGMPDRTFGAQDFALSEPPELEEAWASLDIFPRQSIAQIRNVRNSLRKLAAIKADLGDKRVNSKSHVADKPWIIGEAHSLMTNIWNSALFAADDLVPHIRELAPEMDEADKMMRLYGDPSDEPEYD